MRAANTKTTGLSGPAVRRPCRPSRVANWEAEDNLIACVSPEELEEFIERSMAWHAFDGPVLHLNFTAGLLTAAVDNDNYPVDVNEAVGLAVHCGARTILITHPPGESPAEILPPITRIIRRRRLDVAVSAMSW